MPSPPSDLVQRLVLADGSALIVRPIRPDDAGRVQDFVRNLSDESRYFRFMDTLRELTPRMVLHFTRVDHDSHCALIAVSAAEVDAIALGVARYVADADRARCEFSIVVADAWQRRGLGRQLMLALIAAARAAGLGVMHGDVLVSNARMLRFVTRLGFSVVAEPADPRVLRAELALRP